MNDDLTVRRERLVAQIAIQRGELARAYFNLEKPIRYTEYGMRGLGFMRNNSWIFTAVPALFDIARTLFGGKKKKSPRSLPRQEQNLQAEKNKKPLQVWAGRVWQLYQLYRRVRTLIP